MSAPIILALMTTCFLCFGYLGVPVPFALLGGVFVGALLADVALAAIIQKVFDGVDNEALLAIPFFLLVGELMSSANVVVRIANLSMALVGHMRGGLSQVVTVFSMFFSEMSRMRRSSQWDGSPEGSTEPPASQAWLSPGRRK